MNEGRFSDGRYFPERNGLTGQGIGFAARGLLISLFYGAAFGMMLGGTVGGAIGLFFFIIGILWGLPIGVIIGAIAGANCGFWGAFFGGRWGWTFGTGIGMALMILSFSGGSIGLHEVTPEGLALIVAPGIFTSLIGYFLYGNIGEDSLKTTGFFGSWRMLLMNNGYFSTTFLERFVAGMLMLSSLGLVALAMVHLA